MVDITVFISKNEILVLPQVFVSILIAFYIIFNLCNSSIKDISDKESSTISAPSKLLVSGINPSKSKTIPLIFINKVLADKLTYTEEVIYIFKI